MKTKILFITLLILIIGCSKEDSILINKDGLMYLPDSDKPYTGKVYLNYITGEKLFSGKYENGLLIDYSYLNKDGSTKEPKNLEKLTVNNGLFYDNSDELFSGDVYELYNNNYKIYGIMRNGKLVDDMVREWSDEGVKIEINILNGRRTAFYTKYNDQRYVRRTDYGGIGYTEGRFFGNKKEGTWYYEISERFKILETYKNGKLNGPYYFVDFRTSWSMGGVKKIEGQYKNGKREGIWKISKRHHFINPTLRSTDTPIEKIREMVTVPVVQVSYKNGILDGPYKQYYYRYDDNDGVLNISCTFINGEVQGQLTEYKSGSRGAKGGFVGDGVGEIHGSGEVKDGKQVGVWRYLWEGKYQNFPVVDWDYEKEEEYKNYDTRKYYKSRYEEKGYIFPNTYNLKTMNDDYYYMFRFDRILNNKTTSDGRRVYSPQIPGPLKNIW